MSSICSALLRREGCEANIQESIKVGIVGI
jgi:hypothetical protein